MVLSACLNYSVHSELLRILMSQRFIAVLIAPLLMTLMVASYPGKLEASPSLQTSPPVTGINRYVGTYKGALISVGTEFVITRFFLDSSGKMVGEYTMIPYQGSSRKNESGTLDNCEELPDSEFLCHWHDRYGDGLLALQFDDAASEFRGLWKPSGASDAPHMERKYWLEQTDWNGVRQ